MVLPVRTPLQDVTWAWALVAITIPKLANNTTAKNLGPVIISSGRTPLKASLFGLEFSARKKELRHRVILKANGKLRPLGISSVRDRVCMTAATLVLEPIVEADLPPEQYAYRPGENAQQRHLIKMW